MREVSLDEKYTSDHGRIYLTGIQAIVRLLLVQRRRDLAAGLNTAGFVSGYRGSPLGGLDEALWKAQGHLDVHHVKFQPGINEEMAATAVWGTQQLHLVGESDYTGVFALWYGKGPGVDRCGDVFKHLNFAGSARHGGVLLVAGDDHGAYSSTLPHQSDHLFSASMIPVLYPCNVQEYIELGLHGWAMSRFSGCAVGFKALADTVESSASIEADPFGVQTLLPHDFPMPERGLNCQLSSDSLGLQARKQEALMQDYKIYAALAYARINRLNRIAIDAPRARLGIVASGKSYLDVLEALEELGVTEKNAGEIGIRLFKVSMPWPLEPSSIREFARGLDEILVIEEKRQIVEYQLKEQLYNWRADVRPRVIGKFDERGEWGAQRGDWLLPAKVDFSIAQIARVIAKRIETFHKSDHIRSRLAFLEAKDAVLNKAVNTPPRTAYYCSGCPHNTSTRVPEGSLALAGIGCHVMATAIYPEHNKTMTQMGGEGAPWLGQAPFSKREHVFANLGDGTYFHSGYLAVRAAIAANVNMTYKILYNDAVAMTGGQAVDGQISVAMIAQQMVAEGSRRIAIVTEDLARYEDRSQLPGIATLHDRSKLDQVQEELREHRGVSVLIYDQTCAAEKRRRRKTGEYPKAASPVFINEAVCEGCGDCGMESNCTSILPVETELGRKRAIDQSSCNQDYSCARGFCPSFVSVEGGVPRKSRVAAHSENVRLDPLPAPDFASIRETPYNILITGIGGTGVLTTGALLGMAAHLEGKGISVLDMTGMSQKNGAVTSHIRIARNPVDIRAQRIATGEADLILGLDMLTAGAQDAIAKTRPGRTIALINTHQQAPGQFARNPDWQFPFEEIRALIDESVAGQSHFVDATRLATGLMGDSVSANLFMLGYAFQKGLIPLDQVSILRAIDLNGVAVEANKQAFDWGRRSAVDPERVRSIALPDKPVVVHLPQTLEALLRRRIALLTEYQNADYAKRYEAFVRNVHRAEKEITEGDVLSKAVAKSLFKLMAYKDEYEVARLYTNGEFKKSLTDAFEGPFRIKYHLAPPLLSRRDAKGRIVKTQYGSWMGHAFKLLAKMKFLRGSALDIFGMTGERRLERALIVEYEQSMRAVLNNLSPDNLAQVLELASLPEQIRGFGHIKQSSVEKVRRRWAALSQSLSEEVTTASAPQKAA
jgi:indolepyruvate ferredoxin oxidoreductase